MILSVISILLIVGASAVVRQQAGEDGVSILVIMVVQVLAGRVAVPLITMIKNGLKWTKPEDSDKNFILTLFVSMVLGALSLAITSSFSPIISVQGVVSAITLVFTVGQAAYKLIVSKQPPPDPVPIPTPSDPAVYQPDPYKPEK